jgi:tRNA modification GTPase
VIEVHLDLDGYPVTLLDTAGIRDSDDPVEQEGVRRAQERAAGADLVLWVVDARESSGEGGHGPSSDGPMTWMVFNKADLLSSERKERYEVEFRTSADRFLLSSVSGKGMNHILERLSEHAGQFFGAEPALVARERQRRLLEITRDALDRALRREPSGEDILAEELRAAAVALGRLTGRVDVEDILDVIFRDFCIGK